MRPVLRFVACALLFLLLAAGATVPCAAAPNPNPDAVCDCKAGYGACQHWLRAPGGVTADPCYCDRCREFSQHDGNTVPDGMSALCFQSPRVDCYLKRH